MGNPRRRRLIVQKHLDAQKPAEVLVVDDVVLQEQPEIAAEEAVERDFKAFIAKQTLSNLKKIATNFEVPRDSMKPKSKLAKWLVDNMTEEVYDKYNGDIA